MINYIKKLIEYYIHFGLTLNINKVGLTIPKNSKNPIKIIKHPDNKMSDDEIIREILELKGTPTNEQQYYRQKFRNF